MATTLQPHQCDDIVVNKYIQQHIIQNTSSHRQYPKDIANLILSYYHNPSFLVNAGNLSTINASRNIFTCKLSKTQMISRYMQQYLQERFSFKHVFILMTIPIGIIWLKYFMYLLYVICWLIQYHIIYC